MRNDKDVIQLHKWWMNELRIITKKVMEREDKRKTRAMLKNADALADYASRNEIIDAYGFGYITERKKDKLLDMWDEAEAGGDDLYNMKIDLLQELYQESQTVMRDLGQEV